MQRYEYKIISKGIPAAMNEKGMQKMLEETQKEMNALGAEGWEFVQWKSSMLIFKRAVE